MNEIVENFKNEHSKDFTDISLIPESIIEKSSERLKSFIELKREAKNSSKIFINVYYEKSKKKEHHIEIDGSEKHVDVMTIYDKNVYELIYEYTGEENVLKI